MASRVRPKFHDCLGWSMLFQHPRMDPPMNRLIITALIIPFSCQAHAGQIYKCTGDDGVVLNSQETCGASAVVLNIDPGPYQARQAHLFQRTPWGPSRASRGRVERRVAALERRKASLRRSTDRKVPAVISKHVQDSADRARSGRINVWGSRRDWRNKMLRDWAPQSS